jgi:signal transduction histidine kinase
MAFLALGVALLLAAAFQAQSAVRSHRATVEGVLHDYAATAAWNYRERLGVSERNGEIASMLETAFHYPLHQLTPTSRTIGPDQLQPVVPPTAVLLDPPRDSAERCCTPRTPRGRFAMRFATSDGDGESVGQVPVGLPLARVREIVRREVRLRHLVRRTEGAVGARLAGRPWLLLFSRQLVAGDTLLYVLPLDSATAAPLFEAAFGGSSLLPRPLVGERTNCELAAVDVLTAEGAVLYRSKPAPPARPAAVAELAAAPVGLTIRMALRDEATKRLIIGGPPASRLPLLLGLVVVAGGLLVVAFGQLRREAALARLRSDFVASVSHELRTPLALQRVFLDMLTLGRARTDEQRRWSLENVDRESRRLAHLVENVLRFSRAEQRQLRVILVPTELGAVVRDAAAAFAPLARPAAVTLALHLAAGVVAPADADALRQVLLNLLENAVKYGPRGQTVTVSLAVEGGSATVTVDDEGPGIPPAERATVFEPFRRGAAAIGGAVAGSGIGLSVVREIVRLHGGTVAVTESPTGGARVCVTLPGARVAPATACAPDVPDLVAADGPRLADG